MSLKIIKAGILDTVQDLGRHGHQHEGINPGGVMDRFAASLANALLGKELGSPVIEIHFPAAKIRLTKPCIICITGADFSPTINNEGIPLDQPIFISTEAVLHFTKWKNGARCYLSFFNTMQLQPWLNSFSTNLKAGAGGYKGRKLETGDELPYDQLHLQTTMETFSLLPWHYRSPEKKESGVNFIPGNEWNWLAEKSQIALLNNSFVISPSSDRMGYRLQGEALVQSRQEQLISSAVSFGTVQLLPNGQLIILMADHQTTGGYPRIAHIITADLPGLAQMNAGEKISFVMTTIAEGEEKLVARQQYLMQLQKTCNLKMQNWLHAH